MQTPPNQIWGGGVTLIAQAVWTGATKKTNAQRTYAFPEGKH